MKDINGQDVRKGDLVQLLCEVIAVEDSAGVHVRILNSETDLLIGCKHDEVLGGAVADSELVRFEESAADRKTATHDSDGVNRCRME